MVVRKDVFFAYCGWGRVREREIGHELSWDEFYGILEPFPCSQKFL